MCDEVIFRGRYICTIEDLRKALDGGEIVPSRQYDYTDDAPKPPRISRRETNRRYYVSRRRRMDRQAGAGACLQSVWQALRNDAAP